MTEADTLARALRDARDVEKVNAVQSRARGDWQFFVSRKGRDGWAVGIDADPVKALLKALGCAPSLTNRPPHLAPVQAADPAGIFD